VQLICDQSPYDEETGTCHCWGWHDDSTYKSKTTSVDVIADPDTGAKVMPHALGGWFEGFAACPSFNLSGLDAGGAGFMVDTFRGCTSLRYFDMRTLDTSNAFNMSRMFEGCTALESVTFAIESSRSPFVQGMFAQCTSLREIDTSSVNKTPVSHMMEMFKGCTSLKKANLSGLDTEQCGSAVGVFSDCTALQEVDLSNFDTRGEMTNIDYGGGFGNFFRNCTSLKKITLGPDCNMGSVIPTPSSRYIANATGKWVNENGVAYSPKDIPAFKSGVYTAQIAQPQPPATAKPSPKISLGKASVKVARGSVAYSGRALKPGVVVKVNGKTLRNGTDYTVSYKSNKNVGTAKVTVTGKGSYAGTKAATFKIVPKGTSVSKLAKAKKAFTVKWKKPSKAALKQTTGYQVRWSLKKSMKGAKAKAVKGASSAGKKCTLKVSKLKGGKKYYVQVRAYKKAAGKMYYSSWSKAKAVKTKK